MAHRVQMKFIIRTVSVGISWCSIKMTELSELIFVRDVPWNNTAVEKAFSPK